MPGIADAGRASRQIWVIASPVDTHGRAKAVPFKPGQSGNPGGRKRGVERALRDAWDRLARAGGHESAIDEWVGVVHGIMSNTGAEDKDRLAAARLLKEHTYGMAKQALAVTGDVTPEAQALLAALRLTPHERRLIDHAQDSTAAEDDAAMEALTSGDDNELGG